MWNNRKPKSALVVAYDFPPRRTSGVYRTTRLAKYLLLLGWRPTVLTVERRAGDLEDGSLLEGFPPQIVIERTRDLNVSGWEERVADGIRATGGLKSSAQDSRLPLRDRWVRSTGDLIRSCFYFPDATVGWVPGAVERAIGLHLQRRFDLVYTTSPPRSAPVVGLLLKMVLGLPWVAEFRDPWYPPPRPLRRWSERRLLGIIMRWADRIVVISEGHAKYLAEEYAVPEKKIAVISNGFEESDFQSQDAMKCDFLSEGCFHLSHFGTVYPRFSGCFFDALVEVVRECPELASRLRVNVIGFPDDTVRQYAERSELRNVLRIYKFVPHGVAIDAMRRSDVLLVFLGSRDVARLSGLGKIYDYLRVGRPVLAVAHEGGTAGLVRESRVGWVVDPEDPDAIKETLTTIIRRSRNGDLPGPPPQDFVAQFRFDHLAKKLAEVFESVLRPHA